VIGKSMVIRGPIEFVDHEAGSPLVARPTRTRQCWGLSTSRHMARAFRCSMYASHANSSPVRLTCGNHRHLEADARGLKTKLEQGEAAE
jgi:hypothetical protein